jgi:hypothetical protein
MNTNNTKLIPIIFDKTNSKHIPLPLQPYTYYLVSDLNKKELLTNRLKGISTSKRPPLGTVPEEEIVTPLVPKERKVMFFSTIIDVEKWNEAKWSGMVFLSDPSLIAPPIVGFMFENEEYGEQIFSDLKRQFGQIDQDDEIHLSFIRGISEKKAQDYKVHLGTSHDVIEKKLKKRGLPFDETLFVGLSRVHEMNPPAGSENLDIFENSYNYFRRYGITNVIKSKGSIDLNLDNVIGKKKVNFRTKSEILSDKNDIDQPAFAKEQDS